MKHSINGKTFDEIFGQRGEEVKTNGLKEGEVYIWINDVYSRMLIKYTRSGTNYISAEFAIATDGSISDYFDWFNDKMIRSRFFTATSDQISLLNSYMNESESTNN